MPPWGNHMSGETRLPSEDDRRADDQRDRYGELLSEIRVMLPGVEVLFAFLLTSVFAGRFQEIDLLGKRLFLVSLLAAALTVVVLVVPTLLHRLSGVERERRILIASRFQVLGSILVGISVSTGLFVVVRFVFGLVTAALVTGFVAAIWLFLWYVFPALMDRA